MSTATAYNNNEFIVTLTGETAYTTAATDDAVSLFGNVSADLAVGTIDVTAIGTSLLATRLY
jgi:hypothetical protein